MTSEKLLRVNVLKTLRSALKLLERRGGWIKSVMAKNARGFTVNVKAHDAVRFCLIGSIGRSAISKRSRFLSESLLMNLLLQRKANYRASLSLFNDTQRRKGPVLALLRQGIETVEREGVE